jgi:hypothetical protein
MTMFEVLNPIVQACALEIVRFVANFSDSIKKTIINLVCCWGVILGHRLFIIPTTCVDPLAWWRIHGNQ